MGSTVNSDEQIQLLRVFTARPLVSYGETQNLFVPFEEENRRLLLAVETHENSIVIGERGSGKSSFLNRFFYEFENDSHFIIAKMSALNMPNFNQTSFLSNVFNEIKDIAKNRSNKEKFLEILQTYFASRQERETSPIPNEEDDYYAMMKRFSSLIENLNKNGFTICIILDDTDKINSQLIWQAFRNMRDEIWKLRISIILTALPNQVSEITKPPLDHFFSYWIKLPAFDHMRAKQLIDRRLRDLGFDISVEPNTLEEIVNRADGNPRYILEIFKRLFEQTPIPRVITNREIDNLGVIFSNKLPELEKQICEYLIRNPYTSASSESFIDDMGVKRPRLAQVLNSLKRRGLIGSRQEGRQVTYFVTEKGLKRQEQDKE